ncbi:hypothetical protein FKM82_006674 [Ascaphus truei]
MWFILKKQPWTRLQVLGLSYRLLFFIFFIFHLLYLFSFCILLFFTFWYFYYLQYFYISGSYFSHHIIHSPRI